MQPPRGKWLGAKAANGLSYALGFPLAPETIGPKVDIDRRSGPACLLRRYPTIRSSEREIMTGIDASVFMVGKTNTRRDANLIGRQLIGYSPYRLVSKCFSTKRRTNPPATLE